MKRQKRGGKCDICKQPQAKDMYRWNCEHCGARVCNGCVNDIGEGYYILPDNFKETCQIICDTCRIKLGIEIQ